MSEATKAETAPLGHRWRFFRAGGFDQVRLDRGSDLVALDQLDRKLWVALSCPVRGIEFDERTLELIDTDHDGRIRVDELLNAVHWALAQLKDPDQLVKGVPALPLAAIDDSRDEGRGILASAKQILANLGKADATEISPADTADTQRIFAATRFNGDGVVPPESADEQAVAIAIADIMSCLGGEKDRTGAMGVTSALVDRFFADAEALVDWQAKGDTDGGILPLAAATGGAASALAAVRAKVDDYFIRCRMAAYDPRAAEALNRSAADYGAIAAKDLSVSLDDVGAFPVARVEAGRSLPLYDGINPAWADRMATFVRDVVIPLLGDRTELDGAAWEDVKARFAAYEDWTGAKPATPVAALAAARLKEMLDTGMRAKVNDLIGRDKALEPEANAIASVDRLARYHRDLHKLLNNFVSFRDFYTRRGRATFQAGTLYLDGRSADLCIRVADVGKHSGLANLGRMYLVYLECARKSHAEKIHIAAAITAGDSDQLMVGRNGVFYDRKGQDWDATVVKIIEHPISIRQAFWLPYKRAGRMVGEQVEKFAAARAKTADSGMATVLNNAARTAAAGAAPAAQQPPPPPPPATFDAAKFAGIFAAIGLAIGALGTALASIVTGFIGLSWWQMPLAIMGVILILSGPSVVIAFMKLRQRNLGPLLDANGWAVNARAKINIPFGTALTAVARLPEGAERALTDPYAEKPTPWGLYVGIVVVIAAVAVLWRFGFLGRWLAALSG